MNRTMQRMMIWLCAALLAAGYLLGDFVASNRAKGDCDQRFAEAAQCATDSECMRFCPPDEDDCDGGPQ